MDVTVTYSSAHGGTNWVIARKHGHWAGRKTWMDLSIRRSDSNRGRYPFIALDARAYRSCAGAVSIPHTNGYCVSVELMLGNNSGPQVNVRDLATRALRLRLTTTCFVTVTDWLPAVNREMDCTAICFADNLYYVN